MAEEKELVFAQNNLELFNRLADLQKAKEEIELTEKSVKAKIQESMEEYGIVQFKNDKITISYVKESDSVSIDTKVLKEKEPDLYQDLIADYPKNTHKSAYVRFTFPKAK